jgi:hypothetical protein
MALAMRPMRPVPRQRAQGCAVWPSPWHFEQRTGAACTLSGRLR